MTTTLTPTDRRAAYLDKAESYATRAINYRLQRDRAITEGHHKEAAAWETSIASCEREAAKYAEMAAMGEGKPI